MNVVLIGNPAAGGVRGRRLDNAVGIIKKHTGNLSVFHTRKRGDAELFARTHQDADLVIAAGGDGTFNEVINGLMPAGGTVAFLPVGTTNVLAYELGQPKGLEAQVEKIFNSNARSISLGKILGKVLGGISEKTNDRYFALMAGIGFDGETVYRLNSRLKEFTGKGAYLLSGLKVWKKNLQKTMRVKTDEGDIIDCRTAILSNASCYGGPHRFAPQVSLDEPKLCLSVFTGRSRKSLFMFALRLVLALPGSQNSIESRKVRWVEITSEEQQYVQVDGDYFGSISAAKPARISVVPSALYIKG